MYRQPRPLIVVACEQFLTRTRLSIYQLKTPPSVRAGIDTQSNQLCQTPSICFAVRKRYMLDLLKSAYKSLERGIRVHLV
jgi:hypothetical protein